MKKKRRNPRPERSAFESARAALERAGEEYPPVAGENVPGTPETSEAANVPEESETPVSAIADNAEASGAPENADSAETAIPAYADNVEAQVSGDADGDEAQAVKSTDSAETESPDSTDGVETQTAVNTDNAEAEIPAGTDDAETETPENAYSAETELSGSAEALISGDVDSAETQALKNMDDIEAQSPEDEDTEQAAAFVQPDAAAADAAFSEESADMPTDEPDAAEDANPESDWGEYEPFPDTESEVTDTERHTMETKEITLGYQGPDADESESDEAESGRKSEKRGKKPRFKVSNSLNRLKAALQEYVSREKADKEPDDGPPSAASGDAAIHKRVMQIQDEETRNYLLDRVLPQMTWYGRKSAQYQKMYYRLMLATIVLGALIPIFSLMAHPIVAAVLGVSVTAINAYLALRKYHELWVSYRNAREDLLHNLYCYFNRAGVFAKKDSAQEELDVLLVDTCENTFSKESGGWSTTILHKMS